MFYKFKHQKQEGENWCQAACMSMIYDYFGKTESQIDIVTDIAAENLNKIIFDARMYVCNALNNGLYACFFRITKPYSFLEQIEIKKFVLQISHRHPNNLIEWHSSLFKKRDNKYIYMTDPLSNSEDEIKNGKKYLIDEFIELCRFKGHIKGEDKDLYFGTVFSDNKDLFEYVKCYHCDKEYLTPIIDLNENENLFFCPYCFKNYAQFAVRFGLGFTDTEKHTDALFNNLIFKKISNLREKLKQDNLYLPLVYFSTDENLPRYEMLVSVDNRISFRKNFSGYSDEQTADELLDAFRKEYNYKENTD